MSFCLPKVAIPNIQIEYEDDILNDLQVFLFFFLKKSSKIKFKLSLIENKPEAPWIKRTEDGIVFTDKVQIFQDLDLLSDDKSGEK